MNGIQLLSMPNHSVGVITLWMPDRLWGENSYVGTRVKRVDDDLMWEYHYDPSKAYTTGWKDIFNRLKSDDENIFYRVRLLDLAFA